MRLSQVYGEWLREGQVTEDAGQEAVLAHLDGLSDSLGKAPRLRLRRRSPRGVYIHGGVGRGKSMLMDLFFANAPVVAKRRVHFDAFMLDVHARLHRARMLSADPMPPVIAGLAAEARLLCFDEFQVNDIADAMILARLFTGLLDQGVVVVATSNVAPDDLYRGGLQRALFLPFIAVLKARLDILAMADGPDHRMMRMANRAMWITPDATVGAVMDDLFSQLCAADTPGAQVLDVAGRTWRVPLAARSVCRFDFPALCGSALGAADYLALASRFDVVMVDHVPVLTPEKRNETVRFITLVDQLYEARGLLIASAAAGIDQTCASGNQYAMAYRRTASRLYEMQSPAYISQPRLN